MKTPKEMWHYVRKVVRFEIDIRLIQYYGVKVFFRLSYIDWEKFEVVAATGCPERLIDTLLLWLRNDLGLIETRIDEERMCCLGHEASSSISEALRNAGFVPELPEMYVYRLIRRGPRPRRRVPMHLEQSLVLRPIRVK